MVSGIDRKITRETFTFVPTMTSCTILFHLVCCILMGLMTSSKPLSILLLQSLPSTSHHIWATNLVKGLLREGHQVHAVSTLKTKVEGKLAQNLTYAVFEGLMNSSDKYEDYGPAQWEKYNAFHMAYVTYQWAIYGCDRVIKTNAAKELLEMIKTVKFDVIVQDVTLHQCLYGLWKPLHEIEKDSINIVLINSYCAFEPGIPLPPNALETGGLHVQVVQPIVGDVVVTYSEDVRIFLDGAKTGVIVISLGTNLKWKTVELNKIKSIVLALSKLKQRVLWKLDAKAKVPFKIPDNVMTVKWIPQREVLSHKNVKAFWAQGGLLSTQEAIWEGIPMIITPFFMDQKSNAEILVAKGVGIRLDFKILSTQSVLHAIEEIFYNKSYTKNMKRLSSEFRDRPLPPLDLAIWSIEHAARQPNGSLTTPLRSQSWVEQNLIDVYAFLVFTVFNLLIILLSVFFALKLLINFCYNRIVSKLSKSKQS
ncbi:UDP-glucuronosyltransferase 2B17 [Temnothorax longispinosus]|uniref:UDP-glucuronosyltransferase 2B17 n=1 Tax=Temnothorax longispinosus TaxID=300112 RepID=A0A4S2KT24_9HYME|nr:UDP-glucuronosyltransferase 2B17 [Temnothorax longispinosus]